MGAFTDSDLNLEPRIELIRTNLKAGGHGYAVAAKEAVGLLEVAIKELFRRYLTRLTASDRRKFLEAEQRIGKSQKGFENFTLGELIGLLRESDFLRSWASVSGRELGGVHLINLDAVNTLRIRLVHNAGQATESEALVLFNCLLMFLETLGMHFAASEDDSPRNQSSEENVARRGASFASPRASPAFAGEEEIAKPVRGAPSASASFRIAILYKRAVQPDEQVLKWIETQLRAAGHKVFIDRHLSIGEEWAKEIARQIRESDVVIPLLSESSVQSEMIAYEIKLAHEAAQSQDGKPRLLPVRVDYTKSLPDEIAAILDPIQHFLWKGAHDNQVLIEKLTSSLFNRQESRPDITPARLEQEGGAVPLESEFYLVRPVDNEFYQAIGRKDSILLLKGARQMGKTSLLSRALEQARASGFRVMITDFQKLNAAHLESIKELYLALGSAMALQLKLDVFPQQVWLDFLGPNDNFERYLRKEVLEKLAAPLVWGMDEVDRLFLCSFASEVFGLFRSWHNARALEPSGPWSKLTMAIVYATEAHLFITDMNQSPFNVGTRLTLNDFTFDQVAVLNDRYGSPLPNKAAIARFYRLIGGQPYLTRRGLREMIDRGLDIAALEDVADRDEGPFGDHLRRILVSISRRPGLTEVIRGVLRGRPCSDRNDFYRLRSAGILSGDAIGDARPRCQLYANYLERHLL